MVRLTRIYTRHGDRGDTHLGDMSRTRKTSLRVVAYGEVDELNSAVGVARAALSPGAGEEPDRWLAVIQNDLFDLGADLCRPPADDEGGDDADGPAPLRVEAAQVARLERWCDAANEPLPSLTSFVLPGGTAAAAALHLARTVCRRAERATIALADRESVSPEAISYLNRLSDLLFIMARAANHAEDAGDVLWVPGGERGEGDGSGR